jgi:hypothetical protein
MCEVGGRDDQGRRAGGECQRRHHTAWTPHHRCDFDCTGSLARARDGGTDEEQHGDCEESLQPGHHHRGCCKRNQTCDAFSAALFTAARHDTQ